MSETESLDLDARLKELAALPEGWLDGEGAALGAPELAWVARELAAAEGLGVPKPRLYPTLNGGVQAEWSFQRAEVSAEFFGQSKQVLLAAVDTETGVAEEQRASLGSPQGIAELCSFVERFAAK